MYPLQTKPIYCRFWLFLLGAAFLLTPTAIHAQSNSKVGGNWIWKEVARKSKPQKQFRLTIRRSGDVVSGVYSVDEFINGVWQGEDGNQTPFAGRFKDGAMTIEFDPSATVPGYQENVVYAAPTDGRKPSIASVSLTGNLLIWSLTRGPGMEGVPTKITLRRERAADRK